MKTPSRRIFRNAAILLVLGLVALGASSSVAPLRLLERGLVGQVSQAVDPAPMILDGSGSADDPWMRRLSVPPPAAPEPPRILRIEQDTQGYFSDPVLQPVDFGVILLRLHNAGHKVIGVGNLFAWKDPDPLALTILRKQLDLYDAAVIALPLARGATPEPVAAPFVRWSVPVDRAEGKVNTLPQVNRISTGDLELGGEKTLAGFTILENEADPGEGPQPLIAQWGDRLVFAFPLALEIAKLGLQPEDVIVHVGKEIRLGAGGPVIPIDDFGRGAAPVAVTPLEAPAMRLISETNPLPPAAEPLVLQDVRNALSERENAWSGRLPSALQSMRLSPSFQPAAELPRPDPLAELALVLGMVTLAVWCTAQRRFGWRLASSVLLAGLAVQLLYLFAARQNVWLPPLAMLLPAVAAFGLSFVREAASPAVVTGEPAAPAAPVAVAAEVPVVPVAVAPAAQAPEVPAAPAPVVPVAPAPQPVETPAPAPVVETVKPTPAADEKPAAVEDPAPPAPQPAPAVKKAQPRKAAKKAPPKKGNNKPPRRR